jgi:hypothetical protein
MLSQKEAGRPEKTQSEIEMGSKDLIILNVIIVSPLLVVEDLSVITWLLVKG